MFLDSVLGVTNRRLFSLEELGEHFVSAGFKPPAQLNEFFGDETVKKFSDVWVHNRFFCSLIHLLFIYIGADVMPRRFRRGSPSPHR